MRSSLRSALIALALALSLVAPAFAQTLRAGNGTAAAPSITFNNSLGSGLFRFGPDTLGWSTGGVFTARLQSTGLTFAAGRGTILTSHTSDGQGRILGGDGTAAAPGYAFNAQEGNGVFRSASNVVGIAAAGRQTVAVADSQFRVVLGRADRPSLSFIGDTTTGIYQAGASRIDFSLAGALKMSLNATALNLLSTGPRILGPDGTSTTPTFSFAGDNDSGFGRVGPDTLGFAVGGVARLFLASNRLAPATQIGLGSLTLPWDAVESAAQIHTSFNGFATNPALRFGANNTGLYSVAGGTDTLGITLNNVGNIKFAGGANASILGGAGNMTILAGTGASRTLTLQATNAGSGITSTAIVVDSQVQVMAGRAARPSYSFIGQATTGFWLDGSTMAWSASGTKMMTLSTSALDLQQNAVVLAADGLESAPAFSFGSDPDVGAFRLGANQLAFTTGGVRRLTVNGSTSITSTLPFYAPDGSATAPGFSFGNGTFVGMWHPAGDTLAFSSGVASVGARSLSIVGGASPTLIGGAGNMTLLAGTGASRTLTLQTTNAGGTAINTLVLGADSSTTPLGQVFGMAAGTGTATRPSFSFASDPNTGIYSAAADQIQLTTGGGVAFGAGTTFSAMYANQAATVSAFTNRVAFAQQARGVNGTAALPAYSFSDSTSGMYRVGADTLGFATGGTVRLTLETNGAKVASGNAVYGFTGANFTGMGRATGGDTLLFHVGNSRKLTVNPSGRFKFGDAGTAGAPTLALQSNDDTGIHWTTAGDTIAITTGGSDQLIVANNAATGAGDVALCITTANVMTKGSTCGVSTAKVKHGVEPITNTLAARVLQLQPVRYNYKKGYYDGRAEFGFIAESAAVIDRRFAFYAGSPDQKLNIQMGDPINTNDRAILAAAVAQLQIMYKEIATLREEVATLKQRLRRTASYPQSTVRWATDSVRQSDGSYFYLIRSVP